jgi:CRP-like cAMP-binding protein
VFSDNARRSATVTAVTPVHALVMERSELEHYLRFFPRARQALIDSAEQRQVGNFLKLASPFARLDAATVAQIAPHVTAQPVRAGAVVMRQGEHGDTCYLVQTGQVEVLVEEEGEVRRIAVLGPGTILGEAALLTDTPRNATVRALEDCTLLRLRRSDLFDALKANPRTIADLQGIVHRRARPSRREPVEIEQRRSRGGEMLITLKAPDCHAHYRLAPDGWFIWERLDGKQTVEDIEEAYRRAFPSQDSETPRAIITGLASAGFLDMPNLRSEIALPPHPAWWRRFAPRSRHRMHT